MTGQASAREEDPAQALGERLRAWFAAVAGEPVPERLLKLVERLERPAGQTDGRKR